MKFLLRKSGINYILKNPRQAILNIIGVMLGVAVVTAIDVANSSAYKAFELSMESVSGKTTHHIISNPPGLPDSIFFKIKKEIGVENAAPVFEKFVKIKKNSNKVYTLLGIDPFYETAFRNYTSKLRSIKKFNIEHFITSKNSALLSQKTAKNLNINVGDIFLIKADGKAYKLLLYGVLDFENESDNKIIENIIITDISTAQNLFNSEYYISRIDLIINNDNQYILDKIKRILPQNSRIQKSEARTDSGRQMTDSFRINLSAMSVLALIVGMFLIYNTMTFSVIRRQKLIGLLRSLGITRSEIFNLFIFEALIVGFIGTVSGIFLGLALGSSIITLVSKTINDMYFVLQVQDVVVTYDNILKAVFLGIAATLISAFKPAYYSTKIVPRAALIRSDSESELESKSKRYLFYSLISGAAGTLILIPDFYNIYISYLGIGFVIFSFALITPYLLIISIKILTPFTKKIFGSIGKMSARGISTQLSRTTIAVAALSISISAAIGVGTMVSSFRHTVVDWLNMRLKADIYASVPTMVSRYNDGTFSQEIADKIKQIDGIIAMNLYRENQINDNGKIKHILAAKVQNFNYESFIDNKTDNKILWRQFNVEEGVFVSEAYSYKNKVSTGGKVYIPTNKGRKAFNVIGVFTDYSSDIGLIMMNLSVYRMYFNDTLLSGLAVFVDDKSRIDKIMNQMRDTAGSDINFIVRSNYSLINSSVEIFDRTFLITNVLQLLAIIVSFIGILSALMALQLEKEKEFGILRAIGMVPSQLRKMVIIQTSLMGLIAGIFAIPIGNLLSYILIIIINRRSFGWAVDFQFEITYALQGLTISIIAAVLAGIYPAVKLSKTPAASALREE